MKLTDLGERKMDLAEARAVLESQTGNEVLVPGEIQLLDGRVRVEGTELPCSQNFEKQLCSVARVPYDLYQRSSAGLRTSLVKEFFKPKKYSVIARRNEADTLIPVGDRFMPILDIFDATVGGIKSPMVQSVTREDQMFEVLAVSEQIEVQPKKSDAVMGGVRIMMGQFGGMTTRLAMGSFMFRLVCSNGMIRKESNMAYELRKFDSSANPMDLLRLWTSEILNRVRDEFLPQFAATVGKKVDDPGTMVYALAREAKIPANVTQLLIDQVPLLGPGPDMYDIVNLVTNFAKSHPKYRVRLQQAAGDGTNPNAMRCPSCRKVCG